jgi:HD-GYP domain-containing protein (c-di-GMP phosphodiesterase class II)
MAPVILQTAALRPGMVTAEDVWGTGQLILPKDTTLTHNIIRRLPAWGISAVGVKKAVQEEDSLEAFDYPATAAEQDDPRFFEQYRRATLAAGKVFAHMREHEGLPYNELRQLAAVHIFDLLYTKNILNLLYKLQSSVDYTFVHAVDVGIISGVIGTWMGYGLKEVQMLSLCGLMHDIGKSQIPLSILNKPGQLTAEERQTMNLHPEYGYYLTQSTPGIPAAVQFAVRQHHERENGDGYPNKLKGDKIHPFAKIVAIADTYDALTTNKVYKRSVPPFMALEIITEQMWLHLDRHVCLTFIRRLLNDLTGSTVLLSDGSQAKVMHLGQFLSCRPVVTTTHGKVIDLQLTPDLSIVEILNFRD